MAEAPCKLLGTNGEAAASVDAADDAGRMADDRAPDGKLTTTATNSSSMADKTEHRRTDVVVVCEDIILVDLKEFINMLYSAV